MKKIILENSKQIAFNKNGVVFAEPRPDNLFDLFQIPWNDLFNIMEAAALCNKEGTRAYSDLLQAAEEYLPSLQRRVSKDD